MTYFSSSYISRELHSSTLELAKEKPIISKGLNSALYLERIVYSDIKGKSASGLLP